MKFKAWFRGKTSDTAENAGHAFSWLIHKSFNTGSDISLLKKPSYLAVFKISDNGTAVTNIFNVDPGSEVDVKDSEEVPIFFFRHYARVVNILCPSAADAQRLFGLINKACDEINTGRYSLTEALWNGRDFPPVLPKSIEVVDDLPPSTSLHVYESEYFENRSNLVDGEIKNTESVNIKFSRRDGINYFLALTPLLFLDFIVKNFDSSYSLRIANGLEEMNKHYRTEGCRGTKNENDAFRAALSGYRDIYQ